MNLQKDFLKNFQIYINVVIFHLFVYILYLIVLLWIANHYDDMLRVLVRNIIECVWGILIAGNADADASYPETGRHAYLFEYK